MPRGVLVNTSKQIWGRLQSHLTGFLRLHSIRFGVQYPSLTQPHFRAGLGSRLQESGINGDRYVRVRGITGGDSKEETPETNAATATAKGEASDPARGPRC